MCCCGRWTTTRPAMIEEANLNPFDEAAQRRSGVSQVEFVYPRYPLSSP